MKKSILEVEVSMFKNYYDKIPAGSVNLLHWLQEDKYKDQVIKLRNLDKTERDKIKATLPCITVSGMFTTRAIAGLSKHSGMICIDVDYKDNQHIENYKDLKRILSSAPFVTFCGLSVSGTGYFAIIPIKYPEKHDKQFEALRRMYERLGVVIDISGKDVSRLRGYSWDKEPYINHDAQPFDKVYEEPQLIKASFNFTKYKSKSGNDTQKWVELYINEISAKMIDITDNYKNWLQIGFSLANEFGEAGRHYFHDVSRCNPQYNQDEADKKYTGLLGSSTGKVGIGTFFHLCKTHGVKLS